MVGAKIITIEFGLTTYFNRHNSAPSRSSGRTLRNPKLKVSGIFDSTSNLKIRTFVLNSFIQNIFNLILNTIKIFVFKNRKIVLTPFHKL